MEIKDLTGLSKPLTRLIETVSTGVGAVFAPYLTKRIADAEAYKIKKIGDALSHVRENDQVPAVYDKGSIEVWQKPADNTFTCEPTEVNKRIQSRLAYQESRRQDNIEKITTAAATELLEDAVVSESAPDEDWIARFFAHSQDVGSDEMQKLWGKILSGEIKKPGSYSLRTLDFIKNLTKEEAQVFERIGKFALSIEDENFFVPVHHEDLLDPEKNWLEVNRNISFADRIILSELGIIHPDLGLQFFESPAHLNLVIHSPTHILIISRGEIKSVIHFPVWKFTAVGRELIPLISRPLDLDYMRSIGRFFIRQRGKATLGKIGQFFPDGTINYSLVEQIKMETPPSTPAK